MKDLQPILAQLSGREGFTRLLAGIPATAGMKSGLVALEPGESVGEHRTEAKEEAIIILEGQAEVFCRGQSFLSAPEDSLVYIPPETSHDIKNSGDKLLRYVYVVAPVSRV